MKHRGLLLIEIVMGDGWDVACGITMCVFSFHIVRDFVFLGLVLYFGLYGGGQIKSLKFNSIRKKS